MPQKKENKKLQNIVHAMYYVRAFFFLKEVRIWFPEHVSVSMQPPLT